MNTKFLKKCLTQIGLTEFSATVYIQLMEDRGLSVISLAKINKLSRMSIYKALDELTECGLVVDTSDYRSGIRIQEPDHILGALYDREKQVRADITGLSQILPQIKKHYFEKQDDYITIFHGKTQLQHLYQQVLDQSTGTLRIIGNVDVIVNLIGMDFEYNWFRERVKKGISMQLLAFEDEMVRKHFHKGKEELREIKILPGENSFEGTIMMNETTVTQWNPILPKAISIKDPTFHQMFSSIFSIMWQGL
jgi:sugar-specific transcriptional regulator TrmB